MNENNYGVVCNNNTLDVAYAYYEDEHQSTEISRPVKTFSEYLKKNNAYEEFIENYVEYFLQNKEYYTGVDLTDTVIDIYNISIGENSDQDINYWYNLYMEQPKNLIYDMNEIVFAEVNKRISEQKVEQKIESEFITDEEFKELLEQKATKKYMTFIEGKENSNKIYTDIQKAEVEAKRLSAKEIGLKVFLVEIIKEYKSRLEIEEL